jgi:hypothetical protein
LLPLLLIDRCVIQIEQEGVLVVFCGFSFRAVIR